MSNTYAFLYNISTNFSPQRLDVLCCGLKTQHKYNSDFY